MKDEEAVAAGVEYIHNHKVAPNFYNNEQSLRSVVRTAFLGAIDHYIEIQELARGKPKGVIFNRIKCLIVKRMFAVIRRGTPFEYRVDSSTL